MVPAIIARENARGYINLLELSCCWLQLKAFGHSLILPFGTASLLPALHK